MRLVMRSFDSESGDIVHAYIWNNVEDPYDAFPQPNPSGLGYDRSSRSLILALRRTNVYLVIS